MNFDAIQRVSRALQAGLTNALVASSIPGTVYVGPLDDQDANDAALVLFLYRLAVNADLRNSGHRIQAPGAGTETIVHDGALPVDLYFLLTAGTLQTGGELDSLRTLGCAIQALNDTPNLVGVALEGETSRISLDPVSTEEMSRIWTLFPTANYRTSVVYLASPVWIDPTEPRPLAPPVIQDSYRMGRLIA